MNENEQEIQRLLARTHVLSMALGAVLLTCAESLAQLIHKHGEGPELDGLTYATVAQATQLMMREEVKADFVRGMIASFGKEAGEALGEVTWEGFQSRIRRTVLPLLEEQSQLRESHEGDDDEKEGEIDPAKAQERIKNAMEKLAAVQEAMRKAREEE